MGTTTWTNGQSGDPPGTGLAGPRDEDNAALPEPLGDPSSNGTRDGATAAEAPAGPTSTGTRNARGRFTHGNPGQPRRRTGAPSRNGDIGGGTAATADPALPECSLVMLHTALPCLTATLSSGLLDVMGEHWGKAPAIEGE
jgi:hypothetical protein